MKLFQKRGEWWVDFRTPTNVRKRPPTGVMIPSDPALYGPAEAEAYKRAGEIVKSYMEAGTDKEKIAALAIDTIGELLQQRFDSHWSKLSYGTTMKYTIRKLKRDIGHTPVTDVTSKKIREWKDKWATGELGGRSVAKSTINRYLNALSSTLEIAKQDKLITEMPAIAFDNEGDLVRERYMLDHEEASILKWMRQMQLDDIKERRWEWEYMAALVIFLTDSGFRFGEAFKFTLVGQEADLEHGVTKNTVGRRIPLTARAFKAAQYLLESEHHKDLDRRSRVKPKTAWDWCTHRFDRCLLALKINYKKMPARKKLTLHCMRHTCASRLLVHVNIVVVSKWLGHKNLKTTMRYVKLDTKAFIAGAAALEGRTLTPQPVASVDGVLANAQAIIAALRGLSVSDVTREQMNELQLLIAQASQQFYARAG